MQALPSALRRLLVRLAARKHRECRLWRRAPLRQRLRQFDHLTSIRRILDRLKRLDQRDAFFRGWLLLIRVTAGQVFFAPFLVFAIVFCQGLIDFVIELEIEPFADLLLVDDVEQGKPEPDVYLSTINKLGVDSSNCIAFEDSYSGMLAATRANIKTVVIPQPDKFYQEFNEASLKLQKLSEFNESHLVDLIG